MDFEPGFERSADMGLLARDSAAIDGGPFLRQEGRSPLWNQSTGLREHTIRRMRAELGMPAAQARRGLVAQSMAATRARDGGSWMARLIQRIRPPA